MCYPCTGCNGCGKMDSELFDYLTPTLLCLRCKTEYRLGQSRCNNCGYLLPKPPGEPNEPHN